MESLRIPLILDGIPKGSSVLSVSAISFRVDDLNISDRFGTVLGRFGSFRTVSEAFWMVSSRVSLVLYLEEFTDLGWDS